LVFFPLALLLAGLSRLLGNMGRPSHRCIFVQFFFFFCPLSWPPRAYRIILAPPILLSLTVGFSDGRFFYFTPSSFLCVVCCYPPSGESPLHGLSPALVLMVQRHPFTLTATPSIGRLRFFGIKPVIGRLPGFFLPNPFAPPNPSPLPPNSH